jgi:hypothetical protein
MKNGGKNMSSNGFNNKQQQNEPTYLKSSCCKEISILTIVQWWRSPLQNMVFQTVQVD